MRLKTGFYLYRVLYCQFGCNVFEKFLKRLLFLELANLIRRSERHFDVLIPYNNFNKSKGEPMRQMVNSPFGTLCGVK